MIQPVPGHPVFVVQNRGTIKWAFHLMIAPVHGDPVFTFENEAIIKWESFY